jgi:hypothetical protein
MAFSGLSTNKYFVVNEVAEDVSPIILALSPYEAPVLDWLGDSDGFATSTKHEFFEDFMRPRTIIASGAINSATAATGILVNGLADALTVGTILELVRTVDPPELMQISSIPAGGNSILVNRNYDGGGIGSLAAGGTLRVKEPAAPEGDEHSGVHVARLGNRRANTVGYFKVEIGASGTGMAVNLVGGDSYENARAKELRALPALLEQAVLTSNLNATNSLGTTTATRTMQGLRAQLTAINSSVIDASFAANPHLYVGDAMQNCFNNGASTSEDWGLVAGPQYFRDLSNLNDTKVQDSNRSELFKRVIRQYEGPFGQMTIFLSRALRDREAFIFPRQRVRVMPLQGRSFFYKEMGASGDNLKGMLIGEYTVEAWHTNAMARIRTASPA